MSNTSNLVFVFIAITLVVGGMILALGGMLSEPLRPTNITGVPNTTANATQTIIQTVGASATSYLLPVILIVAVLVVISAIYMFKRR